MTMKYATDSEFYRHLVYTAEDFNHTDKTVAEVANDLQVKMVGLKVKVIPYKTWNPWSSVVGHAKGGTIYVNTRKLDLTLQDRIANLFHEATHLCGYSHRGNTPSAYNNATVPYLASRVFAAYVMKMEAQGVSA